MLTKEVLILLNYHLRPSFRNIYLTNNPQLKLKIGCPKFYLKSFFPFVFHHYLLHRHALALPHELTQRMLLGLHLSILFDNHTVLLILKLTMLLVSYHLSSSGILSFHQLNQPDLIILILFFPQQELAYLLLSFLVQSKNYLSCYLTEQLFPFL